MPFGYKRSYAKRAYAARKYTKKYAPASRRKIRSGYTYRKTYKRRRY